MNQPSFSTAQRLLHWLMAVGILAMLFIGIGMVATVAPAYAALLVTHKTLGIALLALVVLRLCLRLWRGAPALPADLPAPMRLAAHGSHVALYAAMIGMPLLGWGMLSAGGYPIVLLGDVRLPAILPQNAALFSLLRQAHLWLGMAFFALVLLHLAAALFHALIRRDGVLRSMLRSSPAGMAPAE